MEIVGHRAIIDYFKHLRDTGTFHHAYCFSGPAHVGKATFARLFASELLSTPAQKLSLHPDFLFVGQETNEETGKLKKDISAEQIEKIVQKISFAPIMNEFNIVIIDGAEKMNIHGSNALLKTLEEPSTKTLFFLIVENEEDLLATIRSRVHSVHFYAVEKQEIRHALDKFALDEATKNDFAEASMGRPGLALDWAQHSESFEEYTSEVQRFFSLFGCPLYEKLQKIENLFKEKENHIAGREKLKDALHIWQTCIHKIVQGERTDIHLETTQLISIYNSIEKTLLSIGQNVHPRLLVENILLSLP